MKMQTKQIVDRAWGFAHVLRDDGLSYMAYIEQITFLLFLKMADEMDARSPSTKSLIPPDLGWRSLLERNGSSLIEHYEFLLDALSREPGMLGVIFRKPRPDIQNPSTLRRLMVDLIEPINWSSLDVDVKGDVYEGLLARSAEESPRGAGQYFTPRELVQVIVTCMEPKPEDTVCDPAAGTGGFLYSAHDFVVQQYESNLTKAQRRHLATKFVRGWELVPNTARLCVMNLFLHGIDSTASPIEVGADSLAADPNERFSMVLTNPPFGRKSNIGIEIADSVGSSEEVSYRRTDFWVNSKNKQLNFLQHAHTLLKTNGRCAIVVPDNVLFEGGAGEVIRRELLERCNVHTLLRLPTGIFYAQGVKANVLFFDNCRPKIDHDLRRLWIYDFRTDIHFTLRTRPLERGDLEEFVACYKSVQRESSAALWDDDKNPHGRWRSFGVKDLLSRDKANLDIFWLGRSGGGAISESSVDQIAKLIVSDLQQALVLFQSVAERLDVNEDL